jgi:hypothetical protein
MVIMGALKIHVSFGAALLLLFGFLSAPFSVALDTIALLFAASLAMPLAAAPASSASSFAAVDSATTWPIEPRAPKISRRSLESRNRISVSELFLGRRKEDAYSSY